MYNKDSIDEVYPRVYMSGWGPAADEKVVDRIQITHIVSVFPGARPLFKNKGVKYLILNDI